jgi:aromatic-amino-acid transaminase
MLFGAGAEVVSSKRARTVQAPGGTGALRVAGDFLRKHCPDARLWVSDPTWSNHYGIFEAAGFDIAVYPYYNADGKCLDFNGMIATLETIPNGDIVLLHGCCHNPSGMDPLPEQWAKIAGIVAENELIPLIDFAYQGLADGLEQDAAATRLFCAPWREALIASSFSKNLGLYNERVGALTVVAGTEEEARAAFSHVQISIRCNYSSPPSHGGAIVSAVLGNAELKKEWEGEVARIRDRIREMRGLFVETLKAKGVTRDFSFITRQNGMFSFSGLTKEQVATLREKYAIYIVGNGRINVAGMTPDNMDYLCDAIADVLGGE